MKKRTPRRLLLVTPTLMLLGVTQPAAAGDSKLVGGSFCRLTGSINGDVGAADGQPVDDGLLNATTSTRRVACPLVRDSTDEPFTAVFARVLDSTPGVATPFTPRCRMNWLTSSGAHDMSDWVVHDNPSSNSSFTFDSISVIDEVDVPLDGSASVGCDLGAFDTIVGLRWEEDAAAASNDKKVIAGSACYSQSFPTSMIQGTAAGQGWYQASSSPDNWVDCPILRDKWNQEVLGVWVRLDLATTGLEASCMLTSNGVSSFDASEPGTRTSDGSISLDMSTIDHLSGGSYSVSCNLPPNARILSVRWDEAQ